MAKRTTEIALRMALGAMPANVLWLVFGRVIAHVILGLTLGALGAYGLGRVLQGMLVQTSPADPRVLASVGLVLVVVALVTCLVPARRAIGVEPVTALRARS